MEMIVETATFHFVLKNLALWPPWAAIPVQGPLTGAEHPPLPAVGHKAHAHPDSCSVCYRPDPCRDELAILHEDRGVLR